MAEPALRQRVHAVRTVAGIHDIGHQHGVVEALHGDAVPLHDEVIVFQVLRDLQHRRIFKQDLEPAQRLTHRDLVFRMAAAEKIADAGLVDQRHVGRTDHRSRRVLGIIGDRQREADKLRLHGVERRRFGIEGDEARVPGVGNPGIERRQIADRNVARVVDGGIGEKSCARLRQRLGRRLAGLARGDGLALGRRCGISGARRRRGGRGLVEIRPARIRAPLDRHRGRLDCIGICAGGSGDATGERGKFHRLQEGDETRAILRFELKVLEEERRAACRCAASPAGATGGRGRHWR